MTASAVVPGFVPSVHGLHFANAFPAVPALHFPLPPVGPVLYQLPIGNAAMGLCGGMCLYVREQFEAGRPMPPDRVAPGPDDPLFLSIVRRQTLSLDWLRVPLRFYSLQAFRPERLDPFARSLRRRPRTAETVSEWRRIRTTIDAGRLAPVGLIRTTSPNPFLLGHNHQVLAFGYMVEKDRLTLQLYDPNHPDDDTVEIRMRLGVDRRGPATMLQTTGEPLFAFFQEE